MTPLLVKETVLVVAAAVRELQKTIKKWHNQYQENLLPTTKFKNDKLKSYKQTNALPILLTPRQINTVMACLKNERKNK